ncbi:MAG: phosphate propanoyltransferase [Niameybacter sp.]|uniref:phosphate propanoyltransferase n=1 Tax=Niameybacter sp. TaxID=2033640 RepID=UPI002FCC4346
MKRFEIPVGISARHIHLCLADLEVLFGEGATLHPIKTLMGGQYAADERVTIVGGNGRQIEAVRVLGPLRGDTQVELSKTDTMFLKLQAPLRDSGDIEGTPGVTLVGPKGQVTLEKGCIVAKRHVHMSTEDAMNFELKDKDLISLDFEGERSATLNNVLVRVDASFTLELHIDTDEANALDVKPNQSVVYEA